MDRFLLFLLPIVLVNASCLVVGERDFPQARTVVKSVEAGGAETVDAEIVMPAGNLSISGGAANLMDGEFIFTSSALEPEVQYDAAANRGRLTVKGRNVSKSTGIDSSNRWNIHLSDGLPTDLHVKLGAGECNLDLVGMSLRSLELEMGAGECGLDLVGEWDRSFDVKVRGGVGELTVRVPGNVGIEADIRGGIGEINHRGLHKENGRYVNDAFGEAATTITLDLKGGIGEINLIVVD